MKTIHQTRTATGKRASYGNDRGTFWISLDHGEGRTTTIYARATWTEGLARIRELIASHGIAIPAVHRAMFDTIKLAA
ncbi:MAG: hypothetical protein ABI600_08820 [Luteolibacter sp.]